ncbi:MAG: hypothetical protein IT384_13330 [Deltaproteobacteria bacterium]|nr:hypothetical protein [Deltaproteobacteria bacterium]
MSSRWRRRALVALASALSAAACTSGTEPATGNMFRPSGLAYLPRGDSRADVLLADAEAGGIQVIQLRRRIIEAESVDDFVFVRSPALYFPLVIPAPTYPTLVGASSDGKRAYAISATDGLLHVLDVTETPFDVSSTETTGYLPLGSGPIELDGFVDGTAIAVAVAVLPPAPGECAGCDRLLIAFDRLDADRGALVALSVNSSFEATLVDSATVAPSPRDLSVRTATPTGVLLSSASSSTVTWVALDLASAADPLAAGRALDAGGPTGAVVDAAASGAAALRIDRSAAVIFDLEGGALVRSRRSIGSPLRPADPAAAPEPGVVHLLPSPAINAAYGRISNVPINDEGRLLFEPTDLTKDADLKDRGGAILIVHADARATFLIGQPLRLALASPARVARLEPVGSTSVAVDRCTLREPTTCEERVAIGAAGERLPNPECAAEVVRDPSGGGLHLSAVYRGTLLSEEGGALAPGAITATTASFTLLPRAAAVEPRGVLAGDRIVVQAKLPVPCGGARRELIETGTVSAVAGSRVTVDFAGTSTLAVAAACSADRVPLIRYEIFPAGEEVVMVRLADGRPTETLGRFGVASAPGGGVQAELSGPVQLTLTASSGFECETVPLEGAECQSELDCAGRSCLASPVPGCFGRCDVRCEATDPGCLARPLARRCSGIVLQVSAAELQQVVTGLDGSTGEGVFTPATPEDVVFSPMHEGWIISQPGARALTEVMVRPGAGFGHRAYR